MNFAFKMMNCVMKMMNFALQMMNRNADWRVTVCIKVDELYFVFKMMGFCIQNEDRRLHWPGPMIPWFHDSMISWFHDFMISWFHDFMISWFHDSMIPWFRISWFMISWFHDFKNLRAMLLRGRVDISTPHSKMLPSIEGSAWPLQIGYCLERFSHKKRFGRQLLSWD